MLIHAAESSFNKGMVSLKEGHVLEALAFFEAAVALDKRYSSTPPQSRYLSYYGLCLAATGTHMREAVGFCRTAVNLEQFNPDLHANLARVLLRAGLRREAHAVLMKGLRLEPAHLQLNRIRKEMGARRRPTLPFLNRGNRLNVALGRMRNGG